MQVLTEHIDYWNTCMGISCNFQVNKEIGL